MPFVLGLVLGRRLRYVLSDTAVRPHMGRGPLSRAHVGSSCLVGGIYFGTLAHVHTNRRLLGTRPGLEKASEPHNHHAVDAPLHSCTLRTPALLSVYCRAAARGPPHRAAGQLLSRMPFLFPSAGRGARRLTARPSSPGRGCSARRYPAPTAWSRGRGRCGAGRRSGRR